MSGASEKDVGGANSDEMEISMVTEVVGSSSQHGNTTRYSSYFHPC